MKLPTKSRLKRGQINEEGFMSAAASQLVNKRTAKSCCRHTLTHLGLFLLVCIYAVAGAYLLIYYELPMEEKRVTAKKHAAETLNDAVTYITKYVWFLNSQNMTVTDYQKELRRTLSVYNYFIVTKAKDDSYDGYPDSWNYDWTITKSLLFTITTMGAIGYGHIAPKSIMMRIFTIYYGMIGIPLLLLFLANIGDVLAKGTSYIYSRLCCRWCRIRRKVSEAKKKLFPRILWKENVGNESYMPTELVEVPIMVNLLIITVYLAMGGSLFAFWENWELSESIYFCFITLTTIGFGDYVPGNSFSVKTSNAFSSAMKMLTTILYLLFGMALLSMAINLMKEQIVEKVRWMAKEIGVIEEEYDPRIKYKIKRSEDDSIQCTPHDKDGNKRKGLTLWNENDDIMKSPLLSPPAYEPNLSSPNGQNLI